MIIVTKIISPKPESGLDLALLKVKTSYFSDDFYTLAKKTPAPKTKFEIVGHGPRYSSKKPVIEDDNLDKKFGFNYVSSVNDTYINFLYKIDSVYNSKNPSGALPGDSGGPLLINNEIAGIASKSAMGISNYVNLNGTKARKFINDNL